LKSFAEEAGLSDRYAALILRLAYLAPHLVDAILRGAQPGGLSREALLRGNPLSRMEQRRKFGPASA
jgi:hypothetical protein